MFESLFIYGLFMSSLLYPTPSSYLYIPLWLFSLLLRAFFPSHRKLYYKSILALSFLLTILKSSLLIYTSSASAIDPDLEEPLLIFLTTVSPPTIDSCLNSLLPSLIGCISSLICIFLPENPVIPYKYCKISAFLCLLSSPFFAFSIPNLIYIFSLSIWIQIEYVLLKPFNFEYFSFAGLLTSTTQLTLSVLNVISVEQGKCEIFSVQFFVVSLTQIVFSRTILKDSVELGKRKKVAFADSIQENLIDNSNPSHKRILQPSIKNPAIISGIETKITPAQQILSIITYILIKVILILWAISDISLGGLLIITWICYSSISNNILTSLKILRLFLLPLLIIRYFVLYFWWDIEIDYLRSAYFASVMIIIIGIPELEKKLPIVMKRFTENQHNKKENNDPSTSKVNFELPSLGSSPSANDNLFLQETRANAVMKLNRHSSVDESSKGRPRSGTFQPVKNNLRQGFLTTKISPAKPKPLPIKQQITSKLRTFSESLLNLFISYYYIVSIAILVAVGLMEVNLIYFVLVSFGFFLYFVENRKKYWNILLSYIAVILLAKYSYEIFIYYYPNNGTPNDIINIIGLSFSYFPQFYLLWILFLNSSLQKILYNQELPQAEEEKTYVFAIEFLKVYKFDLGIIIFQSLFAFIMMLSHADALNFIRCVLFIVILFKQLFHVKEDIDKSKIYYVDYWNWLKLYCEIALYLRYLFQSATIFAEADIVVPFIGLTAYFSISDRYFYIIIDILLLIVSRIILYINRNSINYNKRIFLISLAVLVKAGDNNQYDKRIASKMRMDAYTKTRMFKFFIEPFQIPLQIIIFTVCIFWKFTVFGLLYLLGIGIYHLYCALNYSNLFAKTTTQIYFLVKDNFETFDKMNRKRLEQEKLNWLYRSRVWQYVFVVTLLSMSISLFTLQIAYNNQDTQTYLNFIISVLISQSSNLFNICYGYAIILVAVIIERFCLQSIQLSHTFTNDSNDTGDDTARELTKGLSIGKALLKGTAIEQKDQGLGNTKPQDTKLEVIMVGDTRTLHDKIGFISALALIKTIFEVALLMIILLLAFMEFRAVSVLYVMLVLFCTMFSDFPSPIILSIGLVLGVWAQYSLVIIKYAAGAAGVTLFQDNDELENYFEFGNPKHIPYLYLDLLALAVSLIYFYYFSYRQKHLEDLNSLKKELKIIDLAVKEPKSIGYRSTSSKLEKILILGKSIFYKFARFYVLIFVMLFISQSQGLISIIYCVLCMIFLLKENQIMIIESSNEKSGKDNKELLSYMEYIIWFIRILIFDITLNMIIQMPLGLVTHENDKIFSALGIIKIWKNEDQESENFLSRFASIQVKIYSFAILLVMHRMMTSDDYKTSHNFECNHIRTNSQVVSANMAKGFEAKVESDKIQYINAKLKYKMRAKQLEEKILMWNSKIERREIGRIDIDRLQGKRLREIWRKDEGVKKKSQDFSMIPLINTYLFGKYLKKMSTISSKLDDKGDVKEKMNRKFIERANFYRNETKSQSLKQDIKSNKVEVKDYYTCGFFDYPKLYFFSIMSNLEWLVYFAFFVNHYKYASLESLILPMSVLGYALLQYPSASPKYFRAASYYLSVVIILKFIFQLDLLKLIFGSWLTEFSDPLKIGFNLASKTYSGTLFYYTLWDTLALFTLLIYEYYLLRIGALEVKQKHIPDNLSLAGVRGRNSNDKPGKDLYVYTLMLQLIMLLYLFLFIPRMEGNEQNIDQALRLNKFRGEMVLSVIFIVLLIIVDRIGYLRHTSARLVEARTSKTDQNTRRKSYLNPNTRKPPEDPEDPTDPSVPEALKHKSQTVSATSSNLKLIPHYEAKSNSSVSFKLVLHWTLLIIMNFIVFWFIPINTSYQSKGTLACSDLFDRNTCNNFEINNFLQIFYVIFSIYLVISAEQIRLGPPTFTDSSQYLTKDISSFKYYMFKVYRATPFLSEIKTCVDWTFTTTSLSIFQWLKHDNIHAKLYLTKCDQEYLKAKIDEETVSTFNKIRFGFAGLLFLLFIILFPLVIYSTYNPYIYNNQVKSASLSLKVRYDNNILTLYETSSAYRIRYVDKHDWEHFTNSSEILDNDFELTQHIELPMDPDSYWVVPKPKKTRFCDNFSGQIDLNNIEIILEYTFIRMYPENQPKVEHNDYIRLTAEQVQDFNEVVCLNADRRFIMPMSVIDTFRIPSAGNRFTPEKVKDQRFLTDIVLTQVKEEKGSYWHLGCCANSTVLDGLKFYVVSDDYSPMTFAFSIFGFYISVVLLLGRLIRFATYGSELNLAMTDMKDPRHFLTLSSQIYYNRAIKNYRMEKVLFFELIDFLRSAEITKYLTGKSSIKLKQA